MKLLKQILNSFNQYCLISSPFDHLKTILVQFIERKPISRVIHYTVGKVRGDNLFVTN